VLVVVDWLNMTCSEVGCSGTTSSRTCSGIRTESRLVVEAISWFGLCCWGLSVITSSEAMSEAFSWLDSYSCGSPE